MIQLPVVANPGLTNCGLSKTDSFLAHNLEERRSKVIHSRLKWTNNCTRAEILNPKKSDAGMYNARVGNVLGTTNVAVQVDITCK